MGSRILQITTRFPVDTAALLAIPGVIAIETLNNQQLKIQHSSEHNPSQQITETIIAAGWELQELTPMPTSIEDIFIQLTEGHPA
jgi:ABC-2 type transport system ATP-binding protein